MRSAPKTIGSVFSSWAIYHPSMRETGHCIVDFEWVQTIFDKISPKTIETVYSLWAIYHPSIEMTGPSVVDLECPQARRRQND